MNIHKLWIAAFIICLSLLTAGCSALVAVGDAAITVGATAVKVTAKVVGAAVDLVIPDSDKKNVDK